MGEVYLAEDERLRRKVALKLLPQKLGEDSERVRRFQREAHAVSALNHPNILTIYDIGEADSRHYIATEFIEGTTLRDRMLTAPPLRLDEVLEMAIGVTKALAAAHDAGIIHRDIKPENIMLRPDGVVKILDFGLAKMLDAPNDTTTGELLGTLLYMSPEQAAGQVPDARSDLYSLGVVLYEALAGTTPYRGDNILELAQAITNKTIAPPSKHAPALPAEVDRIVLGCLQRAPEKRYQRAADLLADLYTVRQLLIGDGFFANVEAYQPTDRWSSYGSKRKLFARPLRAPLWQRVGIAVVLLALAGLALWGVRQASSAGTAVGSVAVLPFVNATGDTTLEYLSDGIAESLIDSLSQLPDLRVAARSAAFRYKGKNVDPMSAGRELRMQGVVTGEVRRLDDRLVVRASLVDVDDGTQLWGHNFTRPKTDILALQQEMAQEIFVALRGELAGDESRRLKATEAQNNEAFELYLKGRYHRFKLTEDGARKGIEFFRQAIDRDPTYALAYAGLADGYYALSNIYMAPHEAMPRAREAAKRALELDDGLAQAHSALALVLVWYEWDFAKGEQEFRRAIALNPNDADAQRQYGTYLTAMGQFERAIAMKRKAVEIDPLSVAASYELARTLFFAGRLDEAEKQLRSTLELDERSAASHLLLAQIALQRNQLHEALLLAEKAMEIGNRQPHMLALWGFINARLGNRESAQRVMQELQARPTYTLPLFLARIHAGLGENDAAMKWLEKAYADRSESIIWLNVDPTFDGCRTDPRFVALLKRAGLNTTSS